MTPEERSARARKAAEAAAPKWRARASGAEARVEARKVTGGLREGVVALFPDSPPRFAIARTRENSRQKFPPGATTRLMAAIPFGRLPSALLSRGDLRFHTGGAATREHPQ
jgi:hypothetical protein